MPVKQVPIARLSTISSFASWSKSIVSVFVSNFDVVPNAPLDEIVDITLLHNAVWSTTPKAYLYMIDDTLVNPHQAWINMGSPAYPTQAQIDTLTAGTLLVRQSLDVKVNGTNISVSVKMRAWSAARIDFMLPAM